MTSTYVNDLRLNEMATGDASGSWGTNTNANLTLIGEALGFGTEAITTNADTHTSTIADGASDPIRAIFIKYTGTLDSTCTITIGPNTVNKFCFIHNATSGSQSIIISQGSGANVTIATGQTKGVYLDGAGSGAAVIDAFATLNVVDLLVDDDLTVTDDLIVGGIVSLADGTAGAPSLTNTGDVNAGLFFSAADTLAFSAGGTAQFTMADGVIAPVTDSDVDLGTSSLYFKNSYIDTVTTTGAITAGGNITRGGTVISDGSITDTGDLTIDVAGDIILDADGAEIILKDAGTRFGTLFKTGNDFGIKSNVADGDLLFKGEDNTTSITALTLDMSAAGAATFNASIKPLTYQETYVASSAASTVTLNLATATSFSLTMAQNTTFAFSNPPGSGTAFSFTLFLTQHSTAVTITWPNTVDWAGGSAPDAAAANAVQAYAFFTRDGGTTYYGFLGGTAIA